MEEEERQAQSVGEDEEPEPARAGVSRWCRCMQLSAVGAGIESLCRSEFQPCQSLLEDIAESLCAPYGQRGVGEVLQDRESELETPANTFYFLQILPSFSENALVVDNRFFFSFLLNFIFEHRASPS